MQSHQEISIKKVAKFIDTNFLKSLSKIFPQAIMSVVRENHAEIGSTGKLLYTEGMYCCSGLILLNLETNVALLAHVSYADRILTVAKRFSQEDGLKIGIFVFGRASANQNGLYNDLLGYGINMLPTLFINSGCYHLAVGYNTITREILIQGEEKAFYDIFSYSNFFPTISSQCLENIEKNKLRKSLEDKFNEEEAEIDRINTFINALSQAAQSLNSKKIKKLLNVECVKKIENLASVVVTRAEDKLIKSILEKNEESQYMSNSDANDQKYYDIIKLFADREPISMNDKKYCMLTYQLLEENIRERLEKDSLFPESSLTLKNCMEQFISLYEKPPEVLPQGWKEGVYMNYKNIFFRLPVNQTINDVHSAVNEALRCRINQ